MNTTIEIDEEILDLLENLNVERRSDLPQISSKRPFGNSDYYKDILQRTGNFDMYSNEYGEINDEGKEIVEEYIRRTKIAFTILLENQELECGTYEETPDGWVQQD